MNTAIAQIISRDFSRKTRSALAKLGLHIYDVVALPDADGSFLNSTRGYKVDDHGTSRILSFLEVLAAAR